MTDQTENPFSDLFAEREALLLSDRFGGIGPLMAALGAQPAPANALAVLLNISTQRATIYLEEMGKLDVPDSQPVDADLVPPMGLLPPPSITASVTLAALDSLDDTADEHRRDEAPDSSGDAVGSEQTHPAIDDGRERDSS